jgi:ribosome assembly protein YihI (activator of Der GTPase)
MVDATDMVNLKKARAELHKGRRAEKKSQDREGASKAGAKAPKKKAKASEPKKSKTLKDPTSQVWHPLAVLCQVRSHPHHQCARMLL